MSIAPARPSRARTTFSLALVVAAVFASVPWRHTTSPWFLGVTAVLVLIALGSWGGVPVTRLIRCRFALSRRRRQAASGVDGKLENIGSERVAALVRVDAPNGAPASGWLPTPMITSYLDRYGVRCAAVRIAFRRAFEEDREAWITLVVDARENLGALMARSARLPLHELAEATRRRLTAQLREQGHAAEHADSAPDLYREGDEDWNGVVVGEERVAAYDVSLGGDAEASLAAIAAYPAQEIWTVLEFTGEPRRPDLKVSCALRKKGVVELLPPGLTPHRGDHRPALAALDPLSTGLL